MRTIALEEHVTTEEFLKATGQVYRISTKSLQAGVEDVNTKLLDMGAGRIADMDANKIDMQVLSLSSVGLDKLDPASATALARDTNEKLAAAVRAHPDRFAAFATLALQEPEKVGAELEHCIKDLGFKGAMVMGSVNGVFLDDPRFTPLFETAQALDVPIYMHPGLPPREVLGAYYGGLPGNIGIGLATSGWGWHAETGMHCLRLILSGLFDRFPRLKIIVGHMGDHLPYNIARTHWVFSELARFGDTLPFKRKVIEYFRENFSITTSGYFATAPLLCALQVIGVDRVLFSVDYPYASNALGRGFLDTLPVSPEDFEKITHANAERLLKL
jgi:uncharacterized protein